MYRLPRVNQYRHAGDGGLPKGTTKLNKALYAVRAYTGDQQSGSAGIDLLIVVALTALIFLFAATVELNEWIVFITRPLEPYQLDELPITVMVLVIGMGWFSWRRWIAFSRENALRLEAQKSLAELLTENRLLAQKNVLAQEEERRVLAHELHDEFGQSLNAIKLDAVAIRDRVLDEQDEININARAIIDVANHVHDSVRTLTQRLRPVALDELGLRDALELYVTQWERRNPPVVCRFSAEGSLDNLGELLNITVYRCVQECLTNITRHAQARHVNISVLRNGARLFVQVDDDGKGMSVTTKRGGLGLVGLRERAQSVGGTFTLESVAGGGVHVKLDLPIPKL